MKQKKTSEIEKQVYNDSQQQSVFRPNICRIFFLLGLRIDLCLRTELGGFLSKANRNSNHREPLQRDTNNLSLKKYQFSKCSI